MSDDPQAQRRAHYRLRYPEVERPLVQTGVQDFAVAELSEAGLRVVLGGQTPPEAGAPFRGFLQFRDGEVLLLRGDWLRVEGEEGIIHLSTGISLRRMLDEQRRLLRQYPTHFGLKDTDDAGPF
jgi:hypothetical protein